MTALYLASRAVLELSDPDRAPAFGGWEDCIAAFATGAVQSVGCRACGIAYPVADSSGARETLQPDLDTGELRCPAGHLLADARSPAPFWNSRTPDPAAKANDLAYLEALDALARFEASGRAEDGRAAVELLRRSRSALADAELGQFYYRWIAPIDFDLPGVQPLGVDLGHDEALRRLRRAAEYGVRSALDTLKERYDAGESVAAHADRGERYLDPLRFQSQEVTRRDLRELITLCRRVSPERLPALLERAARNGVADAARDLFALWPRLRDGDGVEKDLELAIECLRAAAEAGHADACYDLGLCYLKGIGTRQHLHMAIALFEQADNAAGHWALAQVFERDDLVQRDAERAARHRERAAELGHEKARAALEAVRRASAMPDCSFTASRVLDALPERVFDAFTDRDALMRWWTDPTLAMTIQRFEPRPGGRWTHHSGPIRPGEAVRYAEYVFDVVDRPARLAFHSPSPPEDRFVVLMEPEASGTRVTISMTFASADAFAHLRPTLPAIAGSRFDRLAAELARAR